MKIEMGNQLLWMDLNTGRIGYRVVVAEPPSESHFTWKHRQGSTRGLLKPMPVTEIRKHFNMFSPAGGGGSYYSIAPHITDLTQPTR